MEVSHCQKQSTSTRLNCIAADSSWYFKSLPDKSRFLYLKGQKQQLTTTTTTSQGLPSPPKPGLLLQPRLEKQLPSGSCNLPPPPNLWQFQGRRAWSQALTAEAAKFSLASPAEKSCSSSDPSTLSSSSSYMWFPCASLQGVWSKEQSPQEL